LTIGFTLLAQLLFRAALQVLVWHAETAAAPDKLEAVWHACVLRYFGGKVQSGSMPERSTDHPKPTTAQSTATSRVLHWEALDLLAGSTWPSVRDALREAGWDENVVYLDGDGGCLALSASTSSPTSELSLPKNGP